MWLNVEYRNANEEVTHYWVGINWVDPATRKLQVDGLHLGSHLLGGTKELTLKLDSILSTAIVEGSYHGTPSKLIYAIESDERYESVFGTVPNLKILDYLYDCAKLNSTPYLREFKLISHIDEDSFVHGAMCSRFVATSRARNMWYSTR